ncbi:leucine-rich repeat-containing protein 63 [Echinops telfairi]|uniref:Leucine-rich repeat-containing protein 63 n=1 Tax=Echinops telfairi TaxID=9371 RepID=A0ABM0ZT70_ECHTE|nr:leucine-rich repeat-containing protein 63 [Echinops telfairi]
MSKRPTLLRRPLPPKLPKLPSHKKRVHTAKTVQIKQPEAEVSQPKATSALSSATSKNQSQTSVSVQTLLLDHHVQEKVAVVKSIAASKHHLQDVCFQIPETAYGSLFFPTSHSASSRVFGKEISVLKVKKKEEFETGIIHGEGFKTVSATQYETVMAMANLAILTCQVYGRNALNLQGFFIIICPDLTPLASQLVYLNLSFNDLCYFPTEVLCLKHLQVLKLRNNPIKEIPSEIQKLKCLRIFTIAFNLITFLPPGLFALAYLEELNVSYNELTSIPNEIYKLRSLEKLNVNGNYLTSFPPGILQTNLKRIQFDNNYTHPSFWKENSLNSPQSLIHLTCSFFLKHNLQKYHDVIPEEIQNLLRCTSSCDWCRGPMFGEGFRIIRSCDSFGVTQFPIMFHVCSFACRGHVRHSS